MPAPSSDPLNLIRDVAALLKEETIILASPEEAQYFRKGYLRNGKSGTGTGSGSGTKKTEPVSKMVVEKIDPVPEFVPLVVSMKIAPVPEPSPPTVWRQEPTAAVEPMIDASSFKSLFAKIAPGVPIVEEIPNDAIAKKIGGRWKTRNQTAPLSILHFTEPPEQKMLLEGIAMALDVYFGPARLIAAESIEKEKQWEAFLAVPDLKMIFACDYTLWQLRDLMRFYKETPAAGTRTLGKVPLFLLPDMSLYLKDPLLKRSLWKALCMKLSS
jgi:hypothetical protein